MIISLKNKYTLQVDDFNFRCCVGKNGLTKDKIEGDKKTPIEHLVLETCTIGLIKFQNLEQK